VRVAAGWPLRKGYATIAAIPPALLAALNRGDDEPRTLAEWLVVDTAALLDVVLRELQVGAAGSGCLEVARACAGLPALERQRRVGAALLALLRARPDAAACYEHLATHRSGVVRDLCPTARDLRDRLQQPERRAEIIAALNERGIGFDELAQQAGQPEADPFDLLCHLAFNAPLRTRRERAQRLKTERKDFFERYSPEARQVLDQLLEKYAEFGDAQFVLPDVLKLPPLSAHGPVADIVRLFGGPEQLRTAVTELQNLLYAA